MVQEKNGDSEKREKVVKVMKKAQKDKAFRKRLMENPEATLKQEGVPLPAGTRVKFIEKTKDTFYYLLPLEDEELSEEQLKKMAAGAARRDKSDPLGLGCASCRRTCGGR